MPCRARRCEGGRSDRRAAPEKEAPVPSRRRPGLPGSSEGREETRRRGGRPAVLVDPAFSARIASASIVPVERGRAPRPRPGARARAARSRARPRRRAGSRRGRPRAPRRSSAAIRPSVENALITSTSPLATAWYISDESMLRWLAEAEAVGVGERRPLRAAEELVVAADGDSVGACGARSPMRRTGAGRRSRGASRARRRSRSRARPTTVIAVRSRSESRTSASTRGALRRYVGALHDRRPDRARVVDVEVEVARVASASKATVEPSDATVRVARPVRARDLPGEDLAQHVLLGEGLGADRDRARRAPERRPRPTVRPVCR